MEKDILKLMEEVDPSNSADVQCVQWVIMALRAALITRTTTDLVEAVTKFASGRPMELMEEIAASRNGNCYGLE
ncbi:MAG: hypothetical protein GY749_25445 [Desulfobacteraceae bacterium]|nr:hypothetical protein [Desulfobacteraceae bacterium]